MDGKTLLAAIEQGTWKGMPQWRCRLCPFDSVESKDVVVDHLLATHFNPKKAAQQAGKPLLLDAHGKPLVSVAPDVEIIDTAEPDEAGDQKKKPRSESS